MKKTFRYNKLFRDRIYEEMLSKGIEIKLKALNGKEDLIKYFKDKILEGATEVCSADSEEELVEELADVLDIVHEFSEVIGVDIQKLEQARTEKFKRKGGFKKHIVVTHDLLLLLSGLPLCVCSNEKEALRNT